MTTIGKHCVALPLITLATVAGCTASRTKGPDELAAEKRIEGYISEGKDLEKCGPRGGPAMWVAAQAGAPDAARMILDKAIDPDLLYQGETPLYEAAKRSGPGYAELVQVLLEGGADPNKGLKPDQDWLPSPRTPFFKASRNPNPEILSLMLKHGANLNTLGDAGVYLREGTALHHAALFGRHANVELLLEAGIDKNAKDGAGRTALEVVDGASERFKTQAANIVKAWSNAPEGVVDYDRTSKLLSQ